MSSLSGTVFNSPLHYSRNLQDLVHVSEILLKDFHCTCSIAYGNPSSMDTLGKSATQVRSLMAFAVAPWLFICLNFNYLWSQLFVKQDHHTSSASWKSKNCKKVNNINVDLFVIPFERKFWSKTITTQIPSPVPIPRYNPVKHYNSTTTQSENYMKRE